MKLLPVLVCVGFLLCWGAALKTAAGRGGKLVACYYQPASFLKPSMVPPDLCDVIIYAFGVIRGGTVEPLSPGDVSTYRGLLALKSSNPDLKVTLSLQSDFSSVVGPDTSKMKRFASNAVSFLRKMSLDGVDFDWEYPKPSQKKAYAAFLQIFKDAVAEEAGKSGRAPLLISMALSNSRPILASVYDFKVINSVVDFATVMAYDFHLFIPKVDNTTGYNSALYPGRGESKYFSVSGLLQAYGSMGLSKSKTLMGMPTYGRSYTLADPSNHGLHAPAVAKGAPGPVRHLRGVYTFPDTCTALQRGAQQQWDSHSQAAFLYQGSTWVAFDNATTFAAKVKWAMGENLAGFGVWSLAMDDAANLCKAGSMPLIRSLKKMVQP